MSWTIAYYSDGLSWQRVTALDIVPYSDEVLLMTPIATYGLQVVSLSKHLHAIFLMESVIGVMCNLIRTHFIPKNTSI